MKQVVIFTLNDLKAMRLEVHAALYYINQKKPMMYDDCKIRNYLENVQKILYREDNQNEQ